MQNETKKDTYGVPKSTQHNNSMRQHRKLTLYIPFKIQNVTQLSNKHNKKVAILAMFLIFKFPFGRSMMC